MPTLALRPFTLNALAVDTCIRLDAIALAMDDPCRHLPCPS